MFWRLRLCQNNGRSTDRNTPNNLFQSQNPPTNSQLAKSRWYRKKTSHYSHNDPPLHNPPNKFTIFQERMVLNKTFPTQQQLPSTSPSPNKFTVVQERTVLKKPTRCSSNYPRLHHPPINPQLSKSRWYSK